MLSRTGLLAAADVARWREAVASLDRDVSDAERVDQLRALEELKAAAAAAQARIAVDLEASQLQAQASAGVPAARRGRGIGARVALARRESPARGGRLLGLGKALVTEMPHTLAALSLGVINEWRATLLVRESACLSVADRAVFDAEVAADPAALAGLGERRLVARAKQVAYRLDAAAVVARAARASNERCVSLRPAPETMTYLTGLLPVTQGVGVYAALTRVADALRAQGDARSRGQIMADTLVERVTGQAHAEDVPIEVHLVMTERTLLGGDDEPAQIPGYGTIPAELARQLINDRTQHPDTTQGAGGQDTAGGTDTGSTAGRPDTGATAGGQPVPRSSGAPMSRVSGDDDGAGTGKADSAVLLWLRRLFTAPTTGQLIAMDSRRRTAPPGLARFIDARDQTCRTPWCDAPIRHRDHITAHADGGATTATNLEGLCEACNYAKQAPGWHARTITENEHARAETDHPRRAGPEPDIDQRAGPETGRARRAGLDLGLGLDIDQRAGPDPGHVVETTTPTGHRYTSSAPPLPGHRDSPRQPATAPPTTPPAKTDSPVERLLADYIRAA
ncbi:HNH endonuclease [Georgenia subflava]|uniref:HNH endonuclease n=1 Tax=Georgenia subflava TaxID=1622177 RepID=UPI001D010493|nr:HNH endonuclease signature motif containing protein [Georgenia subflava]